MSKHPYDLQLLWDKTDYGLLYFHDTFPDSVGKENKNKHFKTHPENSASTILSNKKSEAGIYSIYNFADAKGINPIDHVKQERNCEFLEACEFLFQKYGLSKATNTLVKPETTWKDAKDKAPGFYEIDYAKKVGNFNSFAPFLTADICKEYDFHSINSYTKLTKSGKLMTNTATADYPIFGYKAKAFTKIYEPNCPKNDDYLLKHHFLGTKPPRHVYGWDRLFEKYKTSIEEIEYLEIKKKEEKGFHAKKDIQTEIDALKIDCVVIATGGSDGFNIASLGYDVIWYNSESETISSDEYYRLKKFVKIIYYVPDLDETGVKQAIAIGLQFIQIKILWLPESLKKSHKKDAADWVRSMKHQPIEMVKAIFAKMLSQALNFQFWDTADKSVKLNPKKLLHFLQHQNFRLYRQPFNNSDTGKEDDGYFIKIENNLITKTFPSDIKKHVTQWLDDNFHHINVWNMIARSPFFNQNSLKGLPYYDYKRNNCGLDFQYYFFDNRAIKITAEKIEAVQYSKRLDVNIWAEEKINHFIEVQKPYFETYKDDKERLRVKVLDSNSNYLKVLVNTSRMYWQKDADLTGKDTNIFKITSDKLTDDENYLQELHLLNKMYCVGYLLHQYKSESKAWMVLGVDFTGGTSVKGSYGGTGKSFLQKSLFSMLDAISIGGKTLKDDNFPMDGVTPKKRFVLFDDLDAYQKMQYFYNMTTDNMIANQKGGVKYNIPFDNSAKIGLTTNYAPEMESSTKRRSIVYYNSDYYHEKTADNDYPFSRKISDDFQGRNIMTKAYSSKEWNCDYNFMMQCVQFYLQQTEKIEAPLGTLINKNAMMKVGDATKKFFDDFFEDGTNLNAWVEIKPMVVFQKDELGLKANSSQALMEKLVFYCNAKNWALEKKKRKNESQSATPHFIISTNGVAIELQLPEETQAEKPQPKQESFFNENGEPEPETDLPF